MIYICNEIIPLNDNDIDLVIKLFKNDFYFFTSYPQLLPTCELKVFLVQYGNSYKILNEGKIIGVIFIKYFTDEYVFFRLKIKPNCISENDCLFILKELVTLIKNDFPNVNRLETTIYEFDGNDIDFANKLMISPEIIKENEVFKWKRFWSSYTYSLIDREIDEFTEKKLVNLDIIRYDSKHDELVLATIIQKQILCRIKNDDSKNKSNDFHNNVINHKLFPFLICFDNNIIGTICIDDIDWENRSAMLKCGLINEYISMIDDTIFKVIIKKALDFCEQELRLKRIWGVMDNQSLLNEKVKLNMFNIEGITKSNKIIYYGYEF